MRSNKDLKDFRGSIVDRMVVVVIVGFKSLRLNLLTPAALSLSPLVLVVTGQSQTSRSGASLVGSLTRP